MTTFYKLREKYDMEKFVFRLAKHFFYLAAIDVIFFYPLCLVAGCFIPPVADSDQIIPSSRPVIGGNKIGLVALRWG